MGKYYPAERLKNRHTSAEKLILLMPMIVVCLAARLTSDYFTIDAYNWWYIVLFPGMTAIVCGAVGNRDKKMKNQTILTLPADMGAVWDGKVLYGIRCMGISLAVLLSATLMISTILKQVWQIVFRIDPAAGEQVLAVVVLFLTSLWQIPFCLLLMQVIGRFPMILLHEGSIFLISVTMSLKPYFMLLPGGIAARLMCIILKILPNGLIAKPGSMTFTPELMDWKGVPVGILASLVWFAVFWIVGRKQFERQVQL